MRPTAHALALITAGLLAGLSTACGDEQRDTALEEGPHADLACTECHTSPATNGFVAAVTPGSCDRCHESADLSSNVEIHNVSLTHLTHPTADGDGSLGCAACHTHESGEADLGIATATCFLCHADLPDTAGPQATIAEAECADCHVQPTHTGFATSGAPIDHAAVLERGISCLLCHYDVAAGTGAATRAECRSCHGMPGGAAPLRGDEALDQATVHAVHLDSTIAMTCTRCHEPVNHSVIRLASSLLLDCESCHAPGDPALEAPIDSTAHHETQQIYAGLDPHHPEVEPAVKFIERVSCAGCHGDSPAAQTAGTAASVDRIQRECNACHGARFGPLLGPWVAGMRSNTVRVGEYVRAAAANPRIRGNAPADSMALAAVAVWQHVSAGDGVHNIPGADALLRSAVESAAGAYRQVGVSPPMRPLLGPDPDDVSCVRCHYGVQTIAATIQSRSFSHAEHVIEGRVACDRCHGPADLFLEDGSTFDPAHGGTRISQSDCATCHHVDLASECAACHAPAEVAALRVRADLTVHVQRNELERTRAVPFSHNAHDRLACAECHEPGPSQPVIGCTECHESHHGGLGGAATCNTCHGTGVLEEHEQGDHLICGACHAPATLSMLESADRRFCLQCHTTMADHNPDGECSTCHLLMSPDEAMRQIVNARTIPRGRQ